MNQERIERELQRLRDGHQDAEIIVNGRAYVLYREVPTAGARRGLASSTDVIVPVPEGYPAAMIDLAGLPSGSPFLPLVKGGKNNQGMVAAGGREWQLTSYHPHN